MDLVPFEIQRKLHDLVSGESVLVTQDFDFDLDAFAQDGRCMVWDLSDLDSLFFARWNGREKGTRLIAQHALLDVVWNGHRLKCLQTHIDDYRTSFIIAEDLALTRAFFESVCLFNTDADGRILVFNGRFRRDPELEKSVQRASWENLVLPSDLKTQLHDNVTTFFSSQETYAKHGVAWKRGIMLYGPPGNGKTHAIKALVKEVGRPCLLVKSLRIYDDLEEKAISLVFRRARHMAPAIVVLEDIDSLVVRSSLSALLNEMDGFAENHGILCIATTNHLDKLDPALANRPSRFDRKFEFPNLKREERFGFLKDRFTRQESQMQPSEQGLEQASVGTKGFSGAMLQELVGACLMVWMSGTGEKPMDQVLIEEIASLKPVKEPVASVSKSKKK